MAGHCRQARGEAPGRRGAGAPGRRGAGAPGRRRDNHPGSSCDVRRARHPTPTLRQRSAHLAPYFRSGKRGLAVAIAGSLVTALTEPALPAPMKPLLDKCFGQADIALWLVPVVIIGLFVLRSAAGFIAQYALAWAANEGVLNLRRAMFEHPLTAHPACSRGIRPAI
jgi:hypothetical protein